ncbi:MAG: hypothetical protein JNK02_16860 [Planctomycetes bacterium]|nr:hypothetical protein [Planctomycetota bacterium]
MRVALPWRASTWTLAAAAACLVVAACVSHGTDSASLRLWWAGFGPVLPHDTFPGDCKLCHAGGDWSSLRADFAFDHEAETGVRLDGAHAVASCILCHNDRGPAAVFAQRGCAGCHEDVHQGSLGSTCAECHVETSWRAVGQHAMHRNTRFPLTGVHAITACHRCHPGYEAGRFTPTDTECVTCHASDLARAVNPNHAGLGWVDRCDRCHLTRTWNQAEIQGG